MEQEKYNDEIDLVEVFNNLLKSTFFFFNRWYKTMALSIVIGIVLGGSYYLMNKSKYQNTMLGYSPTINPVLVVNIINSLNEINKADKESVQKLLNLKPADALNILDFTADTVETIVLEPPRNKNALPKTITTISVTLSYKDTCDIEAFTDNLIAYIDNNPYVAKQLKLKKEKLNSLIAQTELEITKLDSLQKALLKNAGEKPGVKKGTLVISNDQVSNFYHNDILNLNNKKQDYLAELEHLTGFEAINRFEPAKIKGHSLIEIVAIITGIIFGLTFFTLLILEIRRKAIRLIYKK